MTPDHARAVLSALPDHDDATIRAAARLLMEEGTADDIRHARSFVSFGLRPTEKETGDA